MATFTVINANDSGPGSLRQAIEDANTTTGLDTIEFDEDLSGQKITLTSGELQIRDDLTISGLGAEELTVSGNDSSRVFEVDDGNSSNQIEVVIDGLTIADGNADQGGGIRNSENLTTTESSITNNTSTQGFGGGVFSRGNSTLTIVDSNISGNADTLPQGPGVRGGGGVAGLSSTIKIIRGTITENTAFDEGGGVLNFEGTLTVTDSNISNNQAPNDNGGGIRNTSDGTVEVHNTKISNNLSGFGGGGIGNGGIATVTDSVIIGNASTGPGRAGGGGIAGPGVLTITRSTISENTAASTGGGIRTGTNGSVTLIDSTLSNNATNGPGGGIWANGATINLLNSTISGNTAQSDGAGIFVNPSGSTDLKLTSSTVTANVADADSNGSGSGGGIFGSGIFSNTIIAENFDTPNNAGPGTINPDVSGTFTSEGYNLVGDGTGSSGFSSPGDQVGTSENPIDPLLGPLQDNGGSTQTHALLTGSPAIDAGNPNFEPPPEFDQRGSGFPRVLDGDRIDGPRIDIGAYELSPGFFLIEAEDLELVNYRVEDNDFASNGELISLRGARSHTGSASTTFTGREGLYDIVVGYFDENDGNARFSFEVDGVPVDNWRADQNLGSGAPNEKTFTRRTIGGVELETGDELTIIGTRDRSDFARVDFLNLLPRSVFDVNSDPITAVPETETIM